MESKNLIKKYVPRHFRLGVCVNSPVVDIRQDVIEKVPIVRNDGTVVSTQTILKSVPAAEVMSQYQNSAFRLSALIKNGVPLKLVNINSSSSVTIDKLYSICNSISDGEELVARFEAQRKERESWFNPSIEDEK